MSAITPVYGFPFQSLTDPPDGPNLGEDLALAVESVLVSLTTRLQQAEASVAALQSAAPYRARQIVTAPLGTVTFSGIPSNLRELTLRFSCRTDNAVVFQGVNLRVNNDATNNYNSQVLQGSGAAATASNTAATNKVFLGLIYGASGTANAFAHGWTQLIDWDSPHASYLGLVSITQLTGGTNAVDVTGGSYAPAGPYNRLDIFPDAGNFIAGSSFQLEGWLS